MSANGYNLTRIYRQAVEQAGSSDDADTGIAAYQKVIDAGLYLSAGAKQPDIKNSMLMYWSYNNIGDTLMRKNRCKTCITFDPENYRHALDFYHNALVLARDNTEKVSVLQRIAENYRELGDRYNWYLTQEDIVALLREEDKCKAYMKLAESHVDEMRTIEFYEKALQYVMRQEVSVLAKCQSTMKIGERLKELYSDIKDRPRYEKMKDLMEQTALMTVKALKQRFEREKSPERKRRLGAEALGVILKYRAEDKVLKNRLLYKLGNLMTRGEEVVINSKSYNREELLKLM